MPVFIIGTNAASEQSGEEGMTVASAYYAVARDDDNEIGEADTTHVDSMRTYVREFVRWPCIMEPRDVDHWPECVHLCATLECLCCWRCLFIVDGFKNSQKRKSWSDFRVGIEYLD